MKKRIGTVLLALRLVLSLLPGAALAAGSGRGDGTGDRYTDASPWEYYAKSADHYLLHPETRALLERLLQMLRDQGEERTLAYIREDVLHPRDYRSRPRTPR